MAGSVWPQDSLAMFQKSSVKMLTDIKAVNVNLTHPPARDWTAAAVPWPCSPPGPSHTLPPHMTSPAYWPLKQSNKDECWVLTKPGRGTRAPCPSHILVAVCRCRIHMSGAVVASDHHHPPPPRHDFSGWLVSDMLWDTVEHDACSQKRFFGLGRGSTVTRLVGRLPASGSSLPSSKMRERPRTEKGPIERRLTLGRGRLLIGLMCKYTFRQTAGGSAQHPCKD